MIVSYLAALLALPVFAYATAQHKGTPGAVHSASPDLSDIELDTGDEDDDSKPESQHLFPSFSAIFPPLGHSRPSFYPDPSRGYQVEGFRYTPRSNPTNIYTGVSSDDDGVLGSGNFGVIRGGTYYSGGAGDESAFLRGNNAHSRPYRRPNPPPLYRGGGDFFQGFRDFADITTPSKAAYSQYVVVYANRKGSSNGVVGSPRNIMEQLELLEAEDKKSKAKRKLEAHKEKERTVELRKKVKKSPKEQFEPLLALS